MLVTRCWSLVEINWLLSHFPLLKCLNTTAQCFWISLRSNSNSRNVVKRGWGWGCNLVWQGLSIEKQHRFALVKLVKFGSFKQHIRALGTDAKCGFNNWRSSPCNSWSRIEILLENCSWKEVASRQKILMLKYLIHLTYFALLLIHYNQGNWIPKVFDIFWSKIPDYVIFEKLYWNQIK